MPTTTIVFGDHAAILHESGYSDDEVSDYGEIQTFEFDTDAELKAFYQGLEALEGWLGWTIHDSNNTDTDWVIEVRGEPSDPEDDDLPGFFITRAKTETEALDDFHDTIPIACLEDFDITIRPALEGEDYRRIF